MNKNNLPPFQFGQAPDEDELVGFLQHLGVLVLTPLAALKGYIFIFLAVGSLISMAFGSKSAQSEFVLNSRRFWGGRLTPSGVGIIGLGYIMLIVYGMAFAYLVQLTPAQQEMLNKAFIVIAVTGFINIVALLLTSSASKQADVPMGQMVGASPYAQHPNVIKPQSMPGVMGMSGSGFNIPPAQPAQPQSFMSFSQNMPANMPQNQGMGLGGMPMLPPPNTTQPFSGQMGQGGNVFGLDGFDQQATPPMGMPAYQQPQQPMFNQPQQTPWGQPPQQSQPQQQVIWSGGTPPSKPQQPMWGQPPQQNNKKKTPQELMMAAVHAASQEFMGAKQRGQQPFILIKVLAPNPRNPKEYQPVSVLTANPTQLIQYLQQMPQDPYGSQRFQWFVATHNPQNQNFPYNLLGKQSKVKLERHEIMATAQYVAQLAQQGYF